MPRCWRCAWACTPSKPTSGKRWKTRKVWWSWPVDPSSKTLRPNPIIISSFRRRLENWDSWLTLWLARMKTPRRQWRRRYLLPIISWKDWPVRLSTSLRKRKNWRSLLTLWEKIKIEKSPDWRLSWMKKKSRIWVWVRNWSWYRSWKRKGTRNWKRLENWKTNWQLYNPEWNKWGLKLNVPPCKQTSLTSKAKSSIIR